MSNVLEDSLFVSQNKKFDEIQSIVRQFSAEYVGNSIIKDNIFAVIQNYARKKEIALELLRYPIHDDESLTGKAKRWQLDGKGTESFGTLLEKVEYNRQHEYLTESRENEDVAYLAQLKKEYGLD